MALPFSNQDVIECSPVKCDPHIMTSSTEQLEAKSLKQILIAEGRPEGCSDAAVLLIYHQGMFLHHLKE